MTCHAVRTRACATHNACAPLMHVPSSGTSAVVALSAALLWPASGRAAEGAAFTPRNIIITGCVCVVRNMGRDTHTDHR